MRKIILKSVILSIIVIAGICGVINVPLAVDISMPVLETTNLIEEAFTQSVFSSGNLKSNNREYYMYGVIGEGDIAKVKKGQRAVVSGVAFAGSERSAVVVEISDEAHTMSFGSVSETVVDVILKLEEINNASENILPLRDGYTAEAEIFVAEPKTMLIAPYSVIMQDEVGEFVYVLEHNVVTRKDIKTGLELAKGVEILTGLDNNADIICNPETVSVNMLAKKEMQV